MKKIIFIFLLLTVLFISGQALAAVSLPQGLTHAHVLSPGEMAEGKIVLNNKDKFVAEVKIYQTDYLFFADGTNTYEEPGSNPRSNADWITFRPTRIKIPPQSSADVYYKIKVPKSDDLEGTYWSMVMIEEIPKTSPESMEEEKNKIKFGIQTVIRYGVQIIVDIGNTGTTRLKFLDKKLVRDDQGKYLQIDIENTGERWVNPSFWVEIYDLNGAALGRFESARKRIYPGCSVRHKIDITGVPKGKYKALVVIDNEDEQVFGAQYDLDIK